MEAFTQHPNLYILIAVAIVVVLLTIGLAVYLRQRARRLHKEALKDLTTSELKLPEAPVAPPGPVLAPAPAPKLITDSERASKGLGKTKVFFQQTLDKLFTGSQGERFYEDVEEALLTADVGIGFAE